MNSIIYIRAIIKGSYVRWEGRLENVGKVHITKEPDFYLSMLFPNGAVILKEYRPDMFVGAIDDFENSFPEFKWPKQLVKPLLLPKERPS